MTVAERTQLYSDGLDLHGVGSGRDYRQADTTTKIEGTGSEKLQIGAPQVDANTVALWHMEETSGTGAYLKDSASTTASPNVGDGADGTVTVAANKNLNTDAVASGRTQPDAINYLMQSNISAGVTSVPITNEPIQQLPV